MDTRLTALRKEKRVETAMQMQKEIEALSRMTVGQLRQKYLELFGEYEGRGLSDCRKSGVRIEAQWLTSPA